MTYKEVIDGLRFTISMALFDPFTGETVKEPKNDSDKITVDACREAVRILEQLDNKAEDNGNEE